MKWCLQGIDRHERFNPTGMYDLIQTKVSTVLNGQTRAADTQGVDYWIVFPGPRARWLTASYWKGENGDWHGNAGLRTLEAPVHCYDAGRKLSVMEGSAIETSLNGLETQPVLGPALGPDLSDVYPVTWNYGSLFVAYNWLGEKRAYNRGGTSPTQWLNRSAKYDTTLYSLSFGLGAEATEVPCER